jgi:hypothetical protein
MRAKYLALVSATGLGLLALTSLQNAAQADEGYRHRSYHSEYRYRDRDHGDRGDRYSNHDRGHRDHYSYDYRYRDHDRR